MMTYNKYIGNSCLTTELGALLRIITVRPQFTTLFRYGLADYTRRQGLHEILSGMQVLILLPQILIRRPHINSKKSDLLASFDLKPSCMEGNGYPSTAYFKILTYDYITLNILKFIYLFCYFMNMDAKIIYLQIAQ